MAVLLLFHAQACVWREPRLWPCSWVTTSTLQLYVGTLE